MKFAHSIFLLFTLYLPSFSQISTDLIEGCDTSYGSNPVMLTASPVQGISDYVFEVISTNPSFSITFNASETNTLNASNVFPFSPNKVYGARVKPDSPAGVYSDTCYFNTIVEGSLQSNDCNKSYETNTKLHADLVSGATNYLFRLVNRNTGDTTHVFSGSDGILTVGLDLTLDLGVAYDVSIQAHMGNEMGNFGDPCTIFGALVCDGSPGFYSTFAYDDFKSVDEYEIVSPGGLYWLESNTQQFSADFTRTTNGMQIDLTQGYAQYDPLLLTFSDDIQGSQLLDLTNDAKFSLTVTNQSPDSTIKIWIMLQDDNGNMLDTWKEAGNDDPGNAWVYQTSITIAPGQTQTFTGDFEGAYHTNYWQGWPPVLEQNCDLSRIESIHFTVLNNNQNSADGFQPYALAQTPLIFHEFYMGTPCGTVTSTEESLNTTITMYPQPFYEGFTIEGISSGEYEIHDLMGSVIKKGTISNGTLIDMEGEKVGIYTILIKANNGEIISRSIFKN